MAVQCPFCGEDWTESALRDGFDATVPREPCECDCGAIWYEGMEDVEDD